MLDFDFTHGIAIQVHTVVVRSVITWMAPVKAGIYVYYLQLARSLSDGYVTYIDLKDLGNVTSGEPDF